MTFARLLGALLGIAGLGITAFVAITNQSWFAVFFLGPLLSIPLILAIIGRPRRWFDPAVQFGKLDARGKPLYRRYDWLDYLLLALMLLSAIPLAWFRWHMPSELDPPSDPATFGMCVCLSMAICAYLWQIRYYAGASVLTLLMVISLGGLLMSSGDQRMAIYGFVFFYCGAWSLLRFGLNYSMGNFAKVTVQGRGTGS